MLTDVVTADLTRVMPWIFPPLESIPILRQGSDEAPEFDDVTALVEYTVPDGYRFVLKGVMHTYEGTGFVQGAGNILWNITVNRPVGSTSGRPLQEFSRMATRLGSYDAPFPVLGRLEFAAGEVIRYTVETLATVGTGFPNTVTCMLVGWIYPVHIATPGAR